MPKELQELDDLTEGILNRTDVVFTKRAGELIKYKFRTKKTLYTLKVHPDDATKVETKINSQKNLEIIPV